MMMHIYHPSTLKTKGEDSGAGAGNGASLGYNSSTFLKGNKTLCDSVSNIAYKRPFIFPLKCWGFEYLDFYWIWKGFCWFETIYRDFPWTSLTVKEAVGRYILYVLLLTEAS